MAEKQSVQDVVEEYCTHLRRRAIQGALPCAKRTAEIMRLVVTMQRHPDAAALVDDVRSIGNRIQASKPVELAIGNIVRRVLHIIREEAQTEALESEAEDGTVSSSNAAELSINNAEPQRSQGGPGLLSQALKAPGAGGPPRSALASRTLSLSNLLDVGLQALDQGPVGGDISLQGPALAAAPPEPEVESQTSALKGHSLKAARKAATNWKRKHAVIDLINDLIDELDNITTSITVQGVEHLHANEVILTQGMSHTTYAFLKEAAKKREFQVVVAEGAPKYSGHSMARRLAEAGIQSTVITDSAVFSMMARANKVIVGAHAVLANGGIIAPAGMHMVALAARQFSTPFVVLVGLHKLSPLFPHQQEVVLNEFRSPAEVVSLDMVAAAWAAQAALDAASASAASAGDTPEQEAGAAQDRDVMAGTLHVPNPSFDYIPPELISLFITDTGGYTPSYVYRLLTEYYSREDYLLTKELLAGR